MGDKSKIQWTQATWNPVTGCTKVSQGCKHCYAKFQAWPRLAASPQTVYFGREFEDVRCHPERLRQPLSWKKPRRIFVNSMSDLFHDDVPFDFIGQVFAVMSVTTRHTYQVLTKRPARMLEFFRWAADAYDDWWDTPFPEHVPWRGYDNCGPAFPFTNVWIGVSVEDQATAEERIPPLLETPAAVRFLSCEPLLGPVDVRKFLARGDAGLAAMDPLAAVLLRQGEQEGNAWVRPAVDWVITGGESGPKARPMHPDWARSLRDQCQAAGVPFFFKQWGQWAPSTHLHERGVIVGHQRHSFPWGRCNPQMASVGKRHAGRLLDGRTWDQYPELAQ